MGLTTKSAHYPLAAPQGTDSLKRAHNLEGSQCYMCRELRCVSEVCIYIQSVHIFNSRSRKWVKESGTSISSRKMFEKLIILSGVKQNACKDSRETAVTSQYIQLLTDYTSLD